LDKEIRNSRYRRKNRCTMADGKPIRQTLRIDAFRSYVAATVDLWSFQKSKAMRDRR
jgi:hypothetical protein